MAYHSGKQMTLKPYRTLTPRQKRIFLLYIASWFIPVIFGAVTIFILKKRSMAYFYATCALFVFPGTMNDIAEKAGVIVKRKR